MRTGFTIVEVVAALLLAGVALGLAAPPLLRVLDEAATLSAREEVAGLIAEARVRAVAQGGAVVTIDSFRASSSSATGAVRSVHLHSDFGVRVDLGSRSSVRLPYDALGLGTVASATLAFERGASRRTLVVSAYGRVRR